MNSFGSDFGKYLTLLRQICNNMFYFKWLREPYSSRNSIESMALAALPAGFYQKFYTKETVSKTDNNSKEARKEEISKEDGSRIGNRVYNQRPKEDHVCELLTDNQVRLLMNECFEHCFKAGFRMMSTFKRIISCFTCSLFDNKYVIEAEQKSDRKNIDEYGKILHMHRVAESLLGELIGCGYRALQKGIAWLRKKSTDFVDREFQRHESWLKTKEDFAEYLDMRIPQLVAVN